MPESVHGDEKTFQGGILKGRLTRPKTPPSTSNIRHSSAPVRPKRHNLNAISANLLRNFVGSSSVRPLVTQPTEISHFPSTETHKTLAWNRLR